MAIWPHPEAQIFNHSFHRARHRGRSPLLRAEFCPRLFLIHRIYLTPSAEFCGSWVSFLSVVANRPPQTEISAKFESEYACFSSLLAGFSDCASNGLSPHEHSEEFCGMFSQDYYTSFAAFRRLFQAMSHIRMQVPQADARSYRISIFQAFRHD